MARPSTIRVIAFCAIISACAGPADGPDERVSPLAGRIYDVGAGRTIDEAALLAELERADFVLLGERHDNPAHHRLQARLVRALQARWPAPAPVAFEMIGADRQLTVTEHLQTADGGAAELGAALDWASSGWPAFEMYAPIVEAAVEAGAEVVAANLPEAAVPDVYGRGTAALDPALLRRTGLGDPLPDALGADLRRELEQAHCGHVQGAAIEGMYRVQRARDATMADRLARLAGGGHGILIAGAGHVRKDRGVPWYLDRLRPNSTTVSVAFVEAGSDATSPPEDLPFDYVWFTPPVPRGDPCAAFGSSADPRAYAGREQPVASRRG